MTGAVTLIYQRVRSGPPLTGAPGHWLLLVSAFFIVTYIPLLVLLIWLDNSGSFHFLDSWSFAIYSSSVALQATGYCVATWWTRGLVWKFLFGGLATLDFMQFVFYMGIWLNIGNFGISATIFSSIPAVGLPVLCLGILVTSIVERVKGRKRDWLHWAGVLAYCAQSLLGVLSTLIFYLFPEVIETAFAPHIFEFMGINT